MTNKVSKIQIDEIANLDEIMLERIIECPIDNMVPLNPVICRKCETVFCKDCLESWKRTSNMCPMRCQPMEIINSEKTIVNQQINKIKVLCKYKTKGCKNKIKVSEISQHENICPYQPTECTKCKSEQFQGFIHKHLFSECNCCLVQCFVCREKYNLSAIAEHTKECEDKHYLCSNCNLYHINMIGTGTNTSTSISITGTSTSTSKECKYRLENCEKCKMPEVFSFLNSTEHMCLSNDNKKKKNYITNPSNNPTSNTNTNTNTNINNSSNPNNNPNNNAISAFAESHDQITNYLLNLSIRISNLFDKSLKDKKKFYEVIEKDTSDVMRLIDKKLMEIHLLKENKIIKINDKYTRLLNTYKKIKQEDIVKLSKEEEKLVKLLEKTKKECIQLEVSIQMNETTLVKEFEYFNSERDLKSIQLNKLYSSSMVFSNNLMLISSNLHSISNSNNSNNNSNSNVGVLGEADDIDLKKIPSEKIKGSSGNSNPVNSNSNVVSNNNKNGNSSSWNNNINKYNSNNNSNNMIENDEINSKINSNRDSTTSSNNNMNPNSNSENNNNYRNQISNSGNPNNNSNTNTNNSKSHSNNNIINPNQQSQQSNNNNSNSNQNKNNIELENNNNNNSTTTKKISCPSCCNPNNSTTNNTNNTSKSMSCVVCSNPICGECEIECSASRHKTGKVCNNCISQCIICNKASQCMKCLKKCYSEKCEHRFCDECYKKNHYQEKGPNHNCRFFNCDSCSLTKKCIMITIFCARCDKRVCMDCYKEEHIEHGVFKFFC